MKLLKLRPFKALRPPRLQFFTNSWRFFLALFCAGFPRHLLSFISPVRMLSSCCVPWPLAISLPLLVVFTLSPSFIFPRFYFVRCYIFAVCVLFFPSRHVFVFRLARSSSFMCLYTALLCSVRNVGWEAKEISLQFFPRSAVSRAEKPRRSFNSGREAKKVF